MAWNLFGGSTDFHAASAETQAAIDADKARVIDAGTTHAKLAGSFYNGNNPHGNPYGGADQRNFMYGRTPTGADDAVARTSGIADKGIGIGQQAIDAGNAAGNTASDIFVARQNDANGYKNRQLQQGDFGQQNSTLGQLGGLEAQQGPSGAQAQLQNGTNMGMAQQVALARSGRGFGGNAGAMGLAQSNQAGLAANQANQSAQLSAQENAAWRGRQAANLGTVANAQGQQVGTNLNAGLASQAQNDAATMGLLGMGQNAYFQGQGIQQQGYGQGLQGVGMGLQGQGINNQTRDTELRGGIAQDDSMLRQWAAENNLTLAGQQRQDQQNAAYAQMFATGLSYMSDARAKKDIVRTDEPAHFAQPDVRPLDMAALDDAASRSVEQGGEGYVYKYKDPNAPGAAAGTQYGPMAQALAQQPATATAVHKRPDGKLGIDPGRLTLVNTSAISSQQRQLDEIQNQLALFGKQPGAEYPLPSRGSF